MRHPVAGWQTVALLLMGASLLPGQVEFHGHIYPLVRLTLNEARFLSLPQRLLTLEGTHRGGGVSLAFSAALEYRLGDNSAALDLREAYAEVATGLGDLRFGKQIIAWGAADGNNPTDNVNPYDFYYLFLPGTERKLGTLAASANLYLGSVTVEAVVTPVFQPNRLPLDDEDFPLFGEVPFAQFSEIRPARTLGNAEFGVRVQVPLRLMDFSLSYFDAHDRMFTPEITPFQDPTALLEYHRTHVIGADLVTFLADWAIRAEGAYFLTEDNDGTDSMIRNPYLQYTLQLDRTGDRISLMVQYLGTAITRIDNESVVSMTGEVVTEELNERDKIPPKMGMPFAAIAQNAVLTTASVDFADGRYSLQANALYELDHQGLMLGGRLNVALEAAVDLELGVTYLGGGEESRLNAIGEVFSHVHLGLKYSF